MENTLSAGRSRDTAQTGGDEWKRARGFIGRYLGERAASNVADAPVGILGAWGRASRLKRYVPPWHNVMQFPWCQCITYYHRMRFVCQLLMVPSQRPQNTRPLIGGPPSFTLWGSGGFSPWTPEATEADSRRQYAATAKKPDTSRRFSFDGDGDIALIQPAVSGPAAGFPPPAHSGLPPLTSLV